MVYPRKKIVPKTKGSAKEPEFKSYIVAKFFLGIIFFSFSEADGLQTAF